MRVKRLDLALRLSFTFLLVLAMVKVCSAAPGTRPPGKPIEFWDPNRSEISTNLNQANQFLNRPSTIKQIEEDIFRPLQETLTPTDSLQGVPSVPRRPEPTIVIPSKRAQELLERQKNWIFMNPEEMLGTSRAEESLRSSSLDPRALETEKASAMERYYLSLSRPGTSVAGDRTFNERSEKASAENRPESRRYSPEIARREEDLRRLVADSPATETAAGRRRPLSDVFGTAEPTLTPEQVTQQRLRRQEFRQLLSLPVPAASSLEPVNPFLASGGDLSRPTLSHAPEKPAQGTVSGFGFSDPSHTPGLAATVPRLPDVNSVLQPPSSTPQVKLPEPAPRKPPPSPTFAAPRRSF